MKKITLKAARVNAGYTQKQAANKLNVHQKTVLNWENGTSSPTPKMIDQICELYGFSYNEISFYRES